VPWGFDVLADAGEDDDLRRHGSHLEPDRELIPGVLLDGQPLSEAWVTVWMYERKALDRWTHVKIWAALNRAGVPTATQNARGAPKKGVP
jgi:hypothetical protein